MSGELIALLSALLWAMASVLLTVGAKRLPVVPLNLVRCVVSTSFFWALLPFYGGLDALAAIPPDQWLWLVVSVLGLLVVGDTLYFRSMDLAGVSWAMPVASISPLWAVLLAAWFVDEPLTWTLLLGTVLVIAGVILLSRTAGQSSGGRAIEPAARRAGLLLALLVSVLWAVGQVALKPATAGIHSVVANSVRQPMGMLMLVVVFMVVRMHVFMVMHVFVVTFMMVVFVFIVLVAGGHGDARVNGGYAILLDLADREVEWQAKALQLGDHGVLIDSEVEQ